MVRNIEAIKEAPILKFFAYSHLPLPLLEVSEPFCSLAYWIVDTIPNSAERTVALRKLLEAKDAAVRAALPLAVSRENAKGGGYSHLGEAAPSLVKTAGNCAVHIEDQPPPVPNERPALWDLVIEDMRARDNVGRERYKTALQAFNGRDPLVDAYQEALDLVVYLRQAIVERDEKAAERRKLAQSFGPIEKDARGTAIYPITADTLAELLR